MENKRPHHTTQTWQTLQRQDPAEIQVREENYDRDRLEQPQASRPENKTLAVCNNSKEDF